MFDAILARKNHWASIANCHVKIMRLNKPCHPSTREQQINHPGLAECEALSSRKTFVVLVFGYGVPELDFVG